MQFVELRGMSVLAHRLRQLSRGSSPRQDGFRVEHEVVKCISYILNHKVCQCTPGGGGVD